MERDEKRNVGVILVPYDSAKCVDCFESASKDRFEVTEDDEENSNLKRVLW